MPTLLEFLRKINIRASLALEEPLSLHTSFRIGGPAELFVEPESGEELGRLAAAARAEGLPLTVLGGGANVLVGDRGIRGLVVGTRKLEGLRIEALPDGGLRLRAGAGLSMSRLGEFLLARGLGVPPRTGAGGGERGQGIANFYAMPGSLGGSVYMNARCYEVELSELLESVSFLDAEGRLRELEAGQATWAYKSSPFQPGGREAGALILEASFRLAPAEPEALRSTMVARLRDREAKGHFRLPSAGSMFKNDRSLGRPTGAILDELGFRGRRIGDAMVSPWHANIFVNAGRARAAEVLALVELAREECLARLGARIEPEVLFIGEN